MQINNWSINMVPPLAYVGIVIGRLFGSQEPSGPNSSAFPLIARLCAADVVFILARGQRIDVASFAIAIKSRKHQTIRSPKQESVGRGGRRRRHRHPFERPRPHYLLDDTVSSLLTVRHCVVVGVSPAAVVESKLLVDMPTRPLSAPAYPSPALSDRDGS